MKTHSFVLVLLLLVSCGNDNKSGKRPDNFVSDPYKAPYSSDAEITNVVRTRNGVMVEGTRRNFAIPVSSVTNIFKSRNLVAVIHDNRGLRVKLYNANGKEILNRPGVMRNPRVNVGDDIATVEFTDVMGRGHIFAINYSGKTLVNITAEAVRGKADYGVAAITFKVNNQNHAIVVRANGRYLLRDRKTYIRPEFTIDPYMVILRHGEGIEQIAH
jgi:hypothetical protein